MKVVGTATFVLSSSSKSIPSTLLRSAILGKKGVIGGGVAGKFYSVSQKDL